ncbi:hypothetical protein AU467_27775 [Mesorhizobium loti]|uniref:Tyr recombinase domain-containing protein n=1 Tax=Rhizobium loti TaxID=381 RepID=A0A101KQC6_RHILI|nr:hypothetical protein AU467_27775 [Mesorhizobium loti]
MLSLHLYQVGYAGLIALLSVTGLRISEALKLTVADVTRDGLLIAQIKFRKTCLKPQHDTAVAGLKGYLAHRRPCSETDPVRHPRRSRQGRSTEPVRTRRLSPISSSIRPIDLGASFFCASLYSSCRSSPAIVIGTNCSAAVVSVAAFAFASPTCRH